MASMHPPTSINPTVRRVLDWGVVNHPALKKVGGVYAKPKILGVEKNLGKYVSSRAHIRAAVAIALHCITVGAEGWSPNGWRPPIAAEPSNLQLSLPLALAGLNGQVVRCADAKAFGTSTPTGGQVEVHTPTTPATLHMHMHMQQMPILMRIHVHMHVHMHMQHTASASAFTTTSTTVTSPPLSPPPPVLPDGAPRHPPSPC